MPHCWTLLHSGLGIHSFGFSLMHSLTTFFLINILDKFRSNKRAKNIFHQLIFRVNIKELIEIHPKILSEGPIAVTSSNTKRRSKLRRRHLPTLAKTVHIKSVLRNASKWPDSDCRRKNPRFRRNSRRSRSASRAI